MPSAVTSSCWKAYFEMKEEKKLQEEKKNQLRKEIREEKMRVTLVNKVKTKQVKTEKYESEKSEDWICSRCNESNNEKKKYNIPKNWIEYHVIILSQNLPLQLHTQK